MTPPSLSLEELMLDQRNVLISGRLDADTVNRAAALLMTLDGRSAEPVTVMLNSSGGCLDDVVPLLDVVAAMRAPLRLVVRGRAQATAAVLAVACGGERVVGATATLSLRLEPETSSAPALMVAEQLTAEADRLATLRHELAALVADRTGQIPPWVLDEFDRGPVRSARDALDLGLVDRIEP